MVGRYTEIISIRWQDQMCWHRNENCWAVSLSVTRAETEDEVDIIYFITHSAQKCVDFVVGAGEIVRALNSPRSTSRIGPDSRSKDVELERSSWSGQGRGGQPIQNVLLGGKRDEKTVERMCAKRWTQVVKLSTRNRWPLAVRRVFFLFLISERVECLGGQICEVMWDGNTEARRRNRDRRDVWINRPAPPTSHWSPTDGLAIPQTLHHPAHGRLYAFVLALFARNIPSGPDWAFYNSTPFYSLDLSPSLPHALISHVRDSRKPGLIVVLFAFSFIISYNFP